MLVAHTACSALSCKFEDEAEHECRCQVVLHKIASVELICVVIKLIILKIVGKKQVMLPCKRKSPAGCKLPFHAESERDICSEIRITVVCCAAYAEKDIRRYRFHSAVVLLFSEAEEIELGCNIYACDVVRAELLSLIHLKWHSYSLPASFNLQRPSAGKFISKASCRSGMGVVEHMLRCIAQIIAYTALQAKLAFIYSLLRKGILQVGEQCKKQQYFDNPFHYAANIVQN